MGRFLRIQFPTWSIGETADSVSEPTVWPLQACHWQVGHVDFLTSLADEDLVELVLLWAWSLTNEQGLLRCRGSRGLDAGMNPRT